MSDRLVLYETKVQPVGSTTLHSFVNSKLGGIDQVWEITQLADAAKWFKLVPGDEKFVVLMRRPLPHPPPPISLDDEGEMIEPGRGWYPDPLKGAPERFFDGEFWTVHTRVPRVWELAKRTGVSAHRAEAARQIEQDEQAVAQLAAHERMNHEADSAEVLSGIPEAGWTAGWYSDWVMPSKTRLRFFDGDKATTLVRDGQ